MTATRVVILLSLSLVFALTRSVSVIAVSYSDEEKAKMEELWAVATLWEVGDNRETVPRAREELIKLGLKAVEFILVEKMDTIDSLQTRAIDAVIQALPEISKRMMMDALEKETRQSAAANIIRLLATLRATESARTIMQALQNSKLPSGAELNPRLRRTLLDSLGTLDYQPAMKVVGESLRTGDERERIICAQSISRFSSLDKVPYLVYALGDERFTVRQSARNGLTESFRKAPEPTWKILWEGLPVEWIPAESKSAQTRAGELEMLLGDLSAILVERLQSFSPTVEIAPDKARDILQEIIRTLHRLGSSKYSWSQRYRAVGSLAMIRTPEARDILSILLKEEKHPLVLQLIRETLGLGSK